MRILKALIIGVLIVTLFTSTISAVVKGPSGWASEDVQGAIEKGLVPNLVRANYQTSIKRFEYVLLVLAVLEKKDTAVTITQQHPFSDIAGHAYEEEIVQAFNAGLISGYPDGSFKPNQIITREEISKLVYTLVQALNPGQTIQAGTNNVYSDSIDIRWGKMYIDYCYNNGIIKGTGKDKSGRDMIDPKDPATIEQSIVMLYRLANAQKLFTIIDLGTVELLQYSEDSTTPTIVQSNAINQFAATFGLELGQAIKTLSQSAQIDIIGLDETSASLSFSTIGRINLVKMDNQVDINLVARDLTDATMMDAFYQLCATYEDVEPIQIVVNRSKTSFALDENFVFNESITDHSILKVFSDNETGTLQYAVQYKHILY